MEEIEVKYYLCLLFILKTIGRKEGYIKNDIFMHVDLDFKQKNKYNILQKPTLSLLTQRIFPRFRPSYSKIK